MKCLESSENMTKIFKDILNDALNDNQIILSKGFHLHDAISAIEMMHPKMDSGMILDTNTVSCSSYKHPTQLSIKELSQLLDHLLRIEYTWLDGKLFTHSILTNPYLLEENIVDIMSDDSTESYCLSYYLKLYFQCLQLYNAIISNSGVSLAEEFSPMTYNCLSKIKFDTNHADNLNRVMLEELLKGFQQNDYYKNHIKLHFEYRYSRWILLSTISDCEKINIERFGLDLLSYESILNRLTNHLDSANDITWCQLFHPPLHLINIMRPIHIISIAKVVSAIKTEYKHLSMMCSSFLFYKDDKDISSVFEKIKQFSHKHPLPDVLTRSITLGIVEKYTWNKTLVDGWILNSISYPLDNDHPSTSILSILSEFLFDFTKLYCCNTAHQFSILPKFLNILSEFQDDLIRLVSLSDSNSSYEYLKSSSPSSFIHSAFIYCHKLRLIFLRDYLELYISLGLLSPREMPVGLLLLSITMKSLSELSKTINEQYELEQHLIKLAAWIIHRHNSIITFDSFKKRFKIWIQYFKDSVDFERDIILSLNEPASVVSKRIESPLLDILDNYESFTSSNKISWDMDSYIPFLPRFK